MQPPFVGPSYDLESRPASVQRTVNLVPVPIEPGNERAGWGLEDVPGLVGPVYPTGADVLRFDITPHDLDLTEDISYFPGDETSEAAAAPQDTWTLVELRRDSSGTVELLVNGVVRARELNYTANVGNGSRTYDIGSFDAAQEFVIGQIDRVRVIEGGVLRLSIDFDGPDGATTFTDAAGSTLTRSGAVVQTDDFAYQGSFSADFPGSANIASDRVCNVGAGTFSLSAAVRPTADVSPGQRVISAQDVVAIDPMLTVRVNTGGLVQAQLRDVAGDNDLILNSSDAVAGPLADLAASPFVNVDLTPGPTGVPPGMTVALVWDGTTGHVTIEGTPTTPGTYTVGVTYRNSDTLATLGTSTHTVKVT